MGNRGPSTWGEIVDVAYDLDVDDELWLDGFTREIRTHMDQGFGLYAYVYDLSDPAHFKPRTIHFQGCSPAIQRFAHAAVAATTPDIVRDVLLPHAAGTSSDVLGRRRLAEVYARMAVDTPADTLALNAVDPTGVGCLVVAPLRAMTRLPARQRWSWARMAAHLAGGHRLRRRLRVGPGRPSLDTAEAIFDPRGRVKHAVASAADSGALTWLRDAALRTDRARSRRSADPGATFDLWPVLVDGRWSIVDRFDTDGRRFFVAWRNDPPLPPEVRLTEREFQVARYVSLGHPNKLVAYALGLRTSTVATHLASAQAKLGVRSRVELISLVRTLGHGSSYFQLSALDFAVAGAPKTIAAVATLTPTEQELVDHVLGGRSDREIATARGTSARTVANQLRTLFAKLGVTSRSELAARAIRAADGKRYDRGE